MSKYKCASRSTSTFHQSYYHTFICKVACIEIECNNNFCRERMPESKLVEQYGIFLLLFISCFCHFMFLSVHVFANFLSKCSQNLRWTLHVISNVHASCVQKYYNEKKKRRVQERLGHIIQKQSGIISY